MSDSGPQTRPRSKTMDVPAPSAPVPEQPQRSLTEAEKEEITLFMKALITYYTKHDIKDKWGDIRAKLKSTFDRKTAVKVPPFQAWQVICNKLKSSGFNKWNEELSNEIKEIYNSLHKREWASELLDIDPIRHCIFKNLNEDNKLFKKTFPKQMSNKEKIDLLMLYNDPTSKAFQKLCYYAFTLYLSQLKQILEMSAEIQGSHGKQLRFDINTHRADGECLITAFINGFVQRYLPLGEYPVLSCECLDIISFFKYLLENYDVNLNIPWHRPDETKGNAITHLLAYGGTNLECWTLLKLILQKKPLNQFYIHDEHGTHYGVLNLQPIRGYSSEIKDLVVINNYELLLLYNTAPEKIKWLLDHGGMDPKESGFKHVRGKAISLRVAISSAIYDLEQSLKATENKIRSIMETAERLKTEKNITRDQLMDIVQSADTERAKYIKQNKEMDMMRNVERVVLPMLNERKIEGGSKKLSKRRS